MIEIIPKLTLNCDQRRRHGYVTAARRSLSRSLVLSRISYNDVIYHDVPAYLINRLQRVQLAAASFVIGKYANMTDLLKLGWLPVSHNRELNLCKLTFKALHCINWPPYLRLEVRVPPRALRSSSSLNLVVPRISGILQDCAARVFNNLPDNIKKCEDFNTFKKKCKSHLTEQAKTDI